MSNIVLTGGMMPGRATLRRILETTGRDTILVSPTALPEPLYMPIARTYEHPRVKSRGVGYTRKQKGRKRYVG